MFFSALAQSDDLTQYALQIFYINEYEIVDTTYDAINIICLKRNIVEDCLLIKL